MKVLVLGSDGYIGKPLSMHLVGLGHEVTLVDNFSRRFRADNSLIKEKQPKNIIESDVGSLPLKNMPFDAIYHLAEMPSAPWSMKGKHFACTTLDENTTETLALLWEIKDHCPDAHLIKIGTLGEYGYSHGVTIPEGEIPSHCADNEDYYGNIECPMAGMQFPRNPNSFYHLSKVFDSMNIKFACDTWGLRSTDIMQGIVFGLNYWDEDLTRFDYDSEFGTVINRFCVQALAGHPLTVYGKGGQTRGFLPLRDSIDCLTLALDNPPEAGEYRVFNQFAQTWSVQELAEAVQAVAWGQGMDCQIGNIANPRKELEEHSYHAATDNLRKLGYDPKWVLEEEIAKLLTALKPYQDRINKDIILPVTTWER